MGLSLVASLAKSVRPAAQARPLLGQGVPPLGQPPTSLAAAASDVRDTRTTLARGRSAPVDPVR
jgi:hypothetical protein